MLVSLYQSRKIDRKNILAHQNLSKDLFIRWMVITVMAAFLFPLTATAMVFNGGGFGLIWTAIVSFVGVAMASLWVGSSKYRGLVFAMGIGIDLGLKLSVL